MECRFNCQLNRMLQSTRKMTENPEQPPLAPQLQVIRPETTRGEKLIRHMNTAVGLLSTSNTMGTILAPLSILGGLWSLGQAQNVKGREAHFKAMAMDAALDYVAIRQGRVPPESDFPTPTQAAVGQRILGTNDLSATFHNARERKWFNDSYAATVKLLCNTAKTEEGRKEIRDLVQDYRRWTRANPRSASFGFFLVRR